MWRSMIKTAAATAAYALVHSVLASDTSKRQARALIGTRAYDGLYRSLYIAEAIAGLVVLAAYVRRLPGHELYQAKGGTALALRMGQVAGLAYMGWA